MSVSRFGHGVRMLVPSLGDLAYLRKIRQSELFDRHFYITTNQNMHWLGKIFPERHYILRGESMGLRPNPDFAPFAYLQLNPDLQGVVGQPFKHFITAGRHENRPTKELPNQKAHQSCPVPMIRPDAFPANPAPFAVVVHLYYHEMWPEFAAILKQQRFDFDLFVTVVRFDDDENAVDDDILADFPDAHVYDVPNHGRDLYPFVNLVNSGILSPYRAVCKLHTKKSPHREDGDHWRRHLVQGILGDPDKTRKRLDTFLQRRDCAFWVADGQVYEGTEWWGSNETKTQALMQRIEGQIDTSDLMFPAGSIYWIKPVLFHMIRGMRLMDTDFEPELAQVDGTTAHALERALGYLTRIAGMRVLQATELDQTDRKPVAPLPKPALVSAFYLPQFHPVAENDRWWGKGFTEWTNVIHAEPAFAGHCQPCLPADLGYYDLRVTEVMGEQADMARGHGIDAFCVYHYWFDGQRILEAPIDRLLERPDIAFPFYLCWANESWRRNWDGLSGDVLMPQSYAPGFGRDLAQSLVRYFQDPRYLRPDGTRPRFVIYRPEDMPDPATAVADMRATWREAGIGEVELGAVRFHVPGDHPVSDDLFDFWIEMPPHGLVTGDQFLFNGPNGNQLGFDPSPGFTGLFYDYASLADRACGRGYRKGLPKNTIAGIMPGWDNTARRGLGAHIAYGANPGSFRVWLHRLLRTRLKDSYRNEMFINAWNEWAEKAIMEPTEQYGKAYLRVLAAALAAPGGNTPHEDTDR